MHPRMLSILLCLQAPFSRGDRQFAIDEAFAAAYSLLTPYTPLYHLRHKTRMPFRHSKNGMKVQGVKKVILKNHEAFGAATPTEGWVTCGWIRQAVAVDGSIHCLACQLAIAGRLDGWPLIPAVRLLKQLQNCNALLPIPELHTQ